MIIARSPTLSRRRADSRACGRGEAVIGCAAVLRSVESLTSTVYWRERYVQHREAANGESRFTGMAVDAFVVRRVPGMFRF